MENIFMDEEIAGIGEVADWDFFNHIPEEITLKILSYLSPYTDTKAAKLVNQRWNRLLSAIEHQKKRLFLESIRNCNIVWEMRKQRSYDITDILVPGTRLKRLRTKVQKPNNNVPCPRFSHASVRIDKYLYIFGGSGSGSQGSTFNDMFRLDLSSRSWEKIKAEGLLPAPRECCSIVSCKQLYDPKKNILPPFSKPKAKNKIVIFGGWCQPPTERQMRITARFFEDTQIFHVEELKWERINYNLLKDTYPHARAGHSASMIGNQMVIFGGSQRNQRFNDVWIFNMDTFTWRYQYIRSKVPRERFGHSQFTLNEKSILILGGCGGPNALFADAWLLDVEKWTWHQLLLKDTIYEPPDLWCHASVMIDQDFVVFSEEKKCNYCLRSVQNYRIPTSPPEATSNECACGRVKMADKPSNDHQQSAHLQMYVLDCATLFADSICRWLPYTYLSPAPPTRKLFTADLGINEVLLFGGFQTQTQDSRLQDSTIVVKTRPTTR